MKTIGVLAFAFAFAFAMATAALLASPSPAPAQVADWPTKTVRIVTPFPA